jgi:nitrite reductase/ring-hydroxylating ferredoxin subunit
MRDAVRVTVEADDDDQTVWIHDDEAEIDVGDATFRFSLTTSGSNGSDCTNGSQTESGERGPTGDEDPRRVAAVDEVPVYGTLRCKALDGKRGTEFILRRDEDDDVFAWRNSCPHKPEVPLDPGNGAIVTDRHVVCHEHGARFVRGDGFCSSGPCQGAALAPIGVTVRDGDVYVTDDRFDAAHQIEH